MLIRSGLYIGQDVVLGVKQYASRSLSFSGCRTLSIRKGARGGDAETVEHATTLRIGLWRAPFAGKGCGTRKGVTPEKKTRWLSAQQRADLILRYLLCCAWISFGACASMKR